MIMKFHAYVFLFLGLVSCSVAPVPAGTGPDAGNPPPDLTGVFVSTNGDDANAGTSRSAPLRTLPAALSNALTNGLTNIYVAEGVFAPGSGLEPTGFGLIITNSGLHLSGGWDGGFLSVTGYSVLDGTNGLEHVVYASGVSNMVFQGFMIRNGMATGTLTALSNGGGLLLTNIVSCLLTNTVVSNNSSSRNGGGIWMSGVSNTVCATVLYNQSGNGIGGGVFISSGSFSNRIFADISHNSSLVGGGLYLGADTGWNSVSGTVGFNSASLFSSKAGGGGITLSNSFSNYFSCLVNGNSSGGWGGGYHITGNDNVITGSVSSNSAFQGGGMTYYSGSRNTIQTVVKDNTCINLGGGIYIEYAEVKISSLVLRNSSGYAGGGIFNFWGSVTITNSVVADNANASFRGGGLCDQNTISVTNGSSIYNNSPNDYYKI